MKDTIQVKVCPYCQGENIVRGIRVRATSHYPVQLLVVGYWMQNEPIFADMCKDCGSIVRMYVENTDRNWDQAPDSR